MEFLKHKSTCRKNLKVPDSLDFLGFLHTYLYIGQIRIFMDRKIKIFTKEMVRNLRMSYIWKISVLNIFLNLKIRIYTYVRVLQWASRRELIFTGGVRKNAFYNLKLYAG